MNLKKRWWVSNVVMFSAQSLTHFQHIGCLMRKRNNWENVDLSPHLATAAKCLLCINRYSGKLIRKYHRFGRVGQKASELWTISLKHWSPKNCIQNSPQQPAKTTAGQLAHTFYAHVRGNNFLHLSFKKENWKTTLMTHVLQFLICPTGVLYDYWLVPPPKTITMFGYLPWTKE